MTHPHQTRRRSSRVLEMRRRMAGPDHAVVTLKSDGGYMRRPCSQCPWRKDLPTGVFPAEAFRLSANTAEDGSMHQFSCHEAGAEHAKTCAGFLLANADNNVGARLAQAMGRLDMAEVASPYPLYRSYRAMAEANGVAPDDPALARCPANNQGRAR